MKVLMALVMMVAMFVPSLTIAEDAVQQLQDVSVTINTGMGQGSGVLFTRERDGHDVTFVWTAAHVVDGLRGTRTIIDPATGSEKKVIEFKDANVVREYTENGRRIGEIKLDAKILKYSDSENGEDLALLQIRKQDFTKASAKFFLDDSIPPIGTELYHVGSLLGQVGANSLTSGIVSQIGRVLHLGAEGTIFDQTTVTAFPGSSGGGVFLKSDNRYVGMLVRGSGEQFNLIVPARRIKAWAEKNNIMWALDPNVPLPSAEEMKKLVVEDSGVVFKNGEKCPPSEDAKMFPTLLK